MSGHRLKWDKLSLDLRLELAERVYGEACCGDPMPQYTRSGDICKNCRTALERIERQLRCDD